MKRIILLTVFLLLLSGPTKAQLYQYGITLDYRHTTFKGKLEEELHRMQIIDFWEPHLTGGVYFRLAPYGRMLSWQAELRYTSMDISASIFLPQFGGWSDELTAHVIEIPLNVQLDMGYDVKAIGGIAIQQMFMKKSVSLTSASNFDAVEVEMGNRLMGAFNKVQIRFQLGLRMGFGRLEIEGKYSGRLSSVLRKFSYADQTYQVPVEYNSYHLGLSYRLFASY